MLEQRRTEQAQTRHSEEVNNLSRVPVLGTPLDGWPEISQYQSLGASPTLIPIKLGNSWHIYDPACDTLLDLGLGKVTEIKPFFPCLSRRGHFETERGPYTNYFLPLLEDGKWCFLNLTSRKVIRPGIEGSIDCVSNVAADGCAYVIMRNNPQYNKWPIYFLIELQSKKIVQLDQRIQGKNPHDSPWLGITCGPKGVAYTGVDTGSSTFYYDLLREEKICIDSHQYHQSSLGLPTISAQGEAFAVVRYRGREGLFNLNLRTFRLRPAYDEIYLSDFVGSSNCAYYVFKEGLNFGYGDTSGNTKILPRHFDGKVVGQVWLPYQGPHGQLYAFVFTEGSPHRWQILDLKGWVSVSRGNDISPSSEPPFFSKDGRGFFIVRHVKGGVGENLFLLNENRMLFKSPWLLESSSFQEISILEGRGGRIYLCSKFQNENESRDRPKRWIFDLREGKCLSIRIAGKEIYDFVSPFISSGGDLYAFASDNPNPVAWVAEKSRALVKLT